MKTNYSISLKRRKKNIWKYIVIAVASAAAVFALVYFLFIRGKTDEPEVPLDVVSIVDINSTAVTNDNIEISDRQKEAKIRANSINDPYVFGSEIIYSSRRDGKGGFKRLIIYNMDSESEKELKVSVQYNNINHIVMNTKYIVFLDSSEQGGGRICVVNRATGEQKSIKDYAYAMPKLVLVENKLVFLQQAGVSTDRLYIYDFDTGESIAAKVFEGTVGLNGGVSTDGSRILYSIVYYENEVLKSHVSEIDLATGEENSYEWDRYVYAPQKNGSRIVFLSSASGVADDLYLSENGEAPKLLESDVTNMNIGDGFVAYTKDDGIYTYVFQTGKHYRLNTTMSKGLLHVVSGRIVCWYDVTTYTDVDAIKYMDFMWE